MKSTYQKWNSQILMKLESLVTGNTQSKITRPNIVEFSDACRLAATNQSLHPLELPSKLRPVKTAKKQQ